LTIWKVLIGLENNTGIFKGDRESSYLFFIGKTSLLYSRSFTVYNSKNAYLTRKRFTKFQNQQDSKKRSSSYKMHLFESFLSVQHSKEIIIHYQYIHIYMHYDKKPRYLH
jgi:hypothetical protein